MKPFVAVANFHPPGRGYMIAGVAIRLALFVQVLDDHGIPHKSIEQIRKEIRSCKLAACNSKQYFLKEGGEASIHGRSQLRCKGCAVIPRSEVPQAFFEIFEGQHHESEGIVDRLFSILLMSKH